MLLSKCQPALQFRAEVCFLSRNLNRLPSRFATQPAIQFPARRLNVSSLFFDGHSLIRPSLCDRNWLPEKSGDLLPPFQYVGLCIWLLWFWHGAGTMLSPTDGLQPQAGTLAFRLEGDSLSGGFRHLLLESRAKEIPYG